MTLQLPNVKESQDSFSSVSVQRWRTGHISEKVLEI